MYNQYMPGYAYPNYHHEEYHEREEKMGVKID